jgi:hypothetical protein
LVVFHYVSAYEIWPEKWEWPFKRGPLYIGILFLLHPTFLLFSKKWRILRINSQIFDEFICKFVAS